LIGSGRVTGNSEVSISIGDFRAMQSSSYADGSVSPASGGTRLFARFPESLVFGNLPVTLPKPFLTSSLWKGGSFGGLCLLSQRARHPHRTRHSSFPLQRPPSTDPLIWTAPILSCLNRSRKANLDKSDGPMRRSVGIVNRMNVYLEEAPAAVGGSVRFSVS
jgi:hypothetical protein